MEYFNWTSFRQNFWWSNRSFLPSLNITPYIQHFSVQPGGSYETKKFLNQNQIQNEFLWVIQEIHPELSPQILESFANLHAQKIIQMTKDDIKWKNGFAHYGKEIPEWTTWEDIKIYLTSYQDNSPGNTFVDIFVKWESFAMHVSMHDLDMEDTVNKDFSVSWKLLIYLCSWKEFSWEETKIPDIYKKTKQRFSEELKNIFCIPWDPLILKDNTYIPQFKVWANYAASVIISDYRCVDIFQ